MDLRIWVVSFRSILLRALASTISLGFRFKGKLGGKQRGSASRESVFAGIVVKAVAAAARPA